MAKEKAKKKTKSSGNQEEVTAFCGAFRASLKAAECELDATYEQFVAESESQGDIKRPWCIDMSSSMDACVLFFRALEASPLRSFARIWVMNLTADKLSSLLGTEPGLCSYLTSKHCSLQELRFDRCVGLDVCSSENGVAKLVASLVANQSLKSVSFNYCSSTCNGIVDSLSQSPKLETLAFKFSFRGPQICGSLSHLLMYARSSLRKLSLQGCQMGNAGVLELVTKGLAVNKSLEILDLAYTGLVVANDDDPLCVALCGLIGHNTVLKSYDFSGNFFGDRAAEAMVRAAVSAKHLQKIVLPETLSAAVFQALKVLLSTRLGTAKKKKKKSAKGKKKK